MEPKSIQKLINKLEVLPGVGPKAASKYVYYLQDLPKEEIKDIAELLEELASLQRCNMCFRIIDQGKEKCTRCKDKQKERSRLAIVAKETELNNLQKSNFSGLFFILGGYLQPDKSNVKDLRIEEIKERAKKDDNLKEIIIAYPPTTDGDITANFVRKEIKDINSDLTITRLGQGLSTGADLRYADQKTLNKALENRD